MTIQKACADHLRAVYNDLPGGKLCSGHAHEVVAAYFGYPTAAALQAETRYPLSNLGTAEILIPDAPLIEKRLKELSDLPHGLPTVEDIVSQVSDFLKKSGHFTGRVTTLFDEIDAHLQENSSSIEDDLSGAIAETNAYFDEIYVEDVEGEVDAQVLSVTATGSLNGETDPDRVFHGDKIAFSIKVTLPRVAGRTAFGGAEIGEASGAVDDSDYYDD